MKTFLAYFTALTILCTACSPKTENEPVAENSSEIKTETFKVDSMAIADSLKVSDSVTASFKMTTLIFPTFSDKMMLDSIYAGQNIKANTYTKDDLQRAIDELKNNYYRENKASLADWSPGFAQTWSQNSAMKIFSKADDMLTVIYLSDGYSGGAHGYYNEAYRVFDLKTNKQLSLNDVIKNQDAQVWARILMTHFLKNDLGVGQAEMLLVKEIPLNNNFYFDKNNLYFLYNQYEIAAYAAGPVLIQIPFAEIKPLLNPNFRNRLQL